MSKAQATQPVLPTSSRADKGMSELFEQMWKIMGSPTAPQLVDSKWREETQGNRAEGMRLRDARRKHLSERLDVYRQESNTKSVSDLLRVLQMERGMAWVDVARMIGVSVPALRKWRKETGDATTENHARLSTLVAFLNTLEEVHVLHPAAWFSLPMLKDYSVTPSDLYCMGGMTFVPLLDFATSTINAQDLLHEVDPEWRTKYHSEYEAYLAADGQMSLRRREAV